MHASPVSRLLLEDAMRPSKENCQKALRAAQRLGADETSAEGRLLLEFLRAAMDELPTDYHYKSRQGKKRKLHAARKGGLPFDLDTRGGER